jgi:hypothetical protein
VLSKRIHPYVLGEFRISHGNVTGHAFCEALSGKVTEDCCGMDEDVLSMFLMR